MSLLGTLSISATALTAQQLRMDILSQNMANVDTTRTAEGGPYRRRNVLFQERIDLTGTDSFSSMLHKAGKLTLNKQASGDDIPFSDANKGVVVRGIVEDPAEGPMVYDPSHPDANEEGYVERPNVNVVTEMVDMISASRSYEANITAMTLTKTMINKTAEILR